MSEQIHFKMLLFLSYFIFHQNWRKYEKNSGFLFVRKQSQNVFILKTDLLVFACTQSAKGTEGANDVYGLLDIQYYTTNSPRRWEGRKTRGLGSECSK